MHRVKPAWERTRASTSAGTPLHKKSARVSEVNPLKTKVLAATKGSKGRQGRKHQVSDSNIPKPKTKGRKGQPQKLEPQATDTHTHTQKLSRTQYTQIE